MSNTLRSEKVELEVLADGCLAITDRRTGSKWRNKSPGYVVLGEAETKVGLKDVATVDITEKDSRITIAFGSGGALPFQLEIGFEMVDGDLRLLIRSWSSDQRLIEIVYPFALGVVRSGVDDGYVTLPYNEGAIIPSRFSSGFMRCQHNTWAAISDVEETIPFCSKRLNMPWFGATIDDASLYCEIETSSDCALSILGNIPFDHRSLQSIDTRDGRIEGERLSALSPVWRASHGALGYTRSMIITAVRDGYVGMCHRYRQSAEAKGLTVTFQEKIRANPAVERMIGATNVKTYIYSNRPNQPILRAFSEPILDGYRCVHTTFDQASAMMKALKKTGVDRAMFLLGGWNRAGYDREHVDMWPPAEPAGGVEGLARLAQTAKENEYVLALHDNYQDFYPDAPSYDEKYIMRDPSGEIRKGGIWDGGLCHLICSRLALGLIQRNLPEILENVAIGGYYLDTVTAAPLYECFAKEHPLTREDDRLAKKAIQDYMIEQGLIVGGEGGTDWAVPTTIFFEGVPGRSVGYTTGVEGHGFGISVPLFNMVYHDCMLQYWQHGQPFGRFDHSSHVLHNVLTAQPANFSIVHEQWNAVLPQIVQCADLLGNLHRATADVKMAGHRFHSADYRVQEATYEDGTVSHANFGFVSHAGEDGELGPRSFSVRYPDGTRVAGSFPATYS